MFGFKTRRRNRLRSQPFPGSWREILQRNVPYYGRLSPSAQEELRGDIQVFIAEKNFEGCGGLEMTDEIKVTIAAYACILLLSIEHHDYYPRLLSILVYPDAYAAPVAVWDGKTTVEGHEVRAGESWRTGAVVISWNHVLHRPVDPSGSRNVALHEFAHQLDQEKGVADGAPLLPKSSMYRAWARILGREYQALTEAADADRPTLLDKYGATNPGEFFAVATEYFFEQSQQLRERHPELYEELKLYYGQDPGKDRLRDMNSAAKKRAACATLLAAAVGIWFAAFYRPGPVEIQDDFEKGFSPSWSWEKPRADAAVIFPDPSRPGNHVAAFFLNRDDLLVHHAKRVEMGLGCVGLGEAYRYVFETFLPTNYPPDASGDNIAQWHDMPDFLLGESWRSPSLKLMIRDGRWFLSHRWSPAKVNRYFWEKKARDTGEEVDLGQAENGKWVRWEFRVLWAWDGRGRLQVLRDGHSLFRKQMPTAYRDWRGPYFKIGMYKPDWSVNGGASSVNERCIYFDNVEVKRIPAADVLGEN